MGSSLQIMLPALKILSDKLHKKSQGTEALNYDCSCSMPQKFFSHIFFNKYSYKNVPDIYLDIFFNSETRQETSR